MAISIYSNGGIKSYGIKHFILDKLTDLKKMKKNYSPGSTLFIIETSETYMLNHNQEWIQINE